MAWILVIFSIAVIIDFLPIVHQKNKKAIIIFIVVFIFAFIYNLLVVLNVDITSTLMHVIKFFQSIGITYPPT